MSCPCKESCTHQKGGVCALSQNERNALQAKATRGPRDGEGAGG